MPHSFIRKLLGPWVLLAVLLSPVLLSHTAAAATTYYVAPTGADSNAGTLSAPFQTVQHAVNAAQPGDTVLVRAGTYYEQVTFDHSGAPGAPITVQNYPNETPIIDGSLDVSGWTLVPGTSAIYQATFTHKPTLATRQGTWDVAAESSCPDGYNYSGDKRAQAYVDTTPDQAHWLQPVCIIGSTPEYAATTIPAGAFATDVAPPPLASGHYYGGTRNTIYVNLGTSFADRNPNHHRLRIAAYKSGILLWNSSDITVRGLTVQLGLGGVDNSDTANTITIDGLDLSLTKERTIVDETFCSTNWTVTNNTIHDIEYEGIHMEGDNSTIAGNTIYNTIAPWSRYGSVGVNVLGVNDTITNNTIHNLSVAQNGHGGTGIYMEEWYNGTGDVGCHSETNQNNVVERNQIYGNDRQGIANTGGDGTTIKNNLIYDNGANGISIAPGEAGSGGATGSQTNATNNSIYNNTLVHNGGTGPYPESYYGVNLAAGSVGTVVRNNVFRKNANDGIYVQAGATSTQDHNLLSATDPLFVSETAPYDFHVQSLSPAIGAGVDLSTVGVTRDYAGTPRAVGVPFVLGAYTQHSITLLPLLRNY